MPDWAGDDARVTLGCFEAGEQRYAIDVRQVREVVRWQAPTPLPNAPALIEGVVDLRGVVIPVLDLGRALSGVATRSSEQARIVVVEVCGLVLGLVVDAAVEVLEVDAATLQEPPALATRAGYGALRAVLHRVGAAPMPVVSLEHLLESIRPQPPAGAEVA